MAAVTAAMVNELRQATGAGLMDCKKALVACEGDMDKAVDYLREKGLASAGKKASRIAAEGMAYAAVVDGVGVVVEVNCESDFVAGNDLFKSFVTDLATVIAKENPADVDALMAAPWVDGKTTVADAKNELFLSVRENMQIRRFQRVAEGVNVPYVHMNGKIGVLVTLDTTSTAPAVIELGKDIAMQIAAMRPQFLDKSMVDEAFVAHEKEVRLAQAKQDPKNAKKPDAIIEKIVMGGVEKMYKEICLLQQAFVKGEGEDVSAHVAAVAKEVGAPIAVKSYVRFEKGEGIEKREDDLAAEVAKLTQG
ncbi:MAG: translation elongation factor Ts [Oscillospiraceae bacterium]|nr:translation elongation factor Ts [Oscillospiraceae bacterium]